MLGNFKPRSLDPQGADDSASWIILHLLGDGLLALEPVGGVSTQLVPDLAKSIPIPTDGGRRYTFDLRPGIPYSNGETVAAVDFRRGIERVFSLDLRSTTSFRGSSEVKPVTNEPRTCDLSRGIETDEGRGGTEITFNLVEPDPEFLYKLTTPMTYPVPPSVPDAEQVRAGVPGTGPYALEAPKTAGGLTLVRNPRFREWSPPAQPDGFVDRIEWTFGVPTEDQVEAVAAGDADLTFDAARSEQPDRLFVRFAAQIHSSQRAQTQFLVLDTQSPPFDDATVRRAMNLVIDRDRVVHILGGEGGFRPTCQQLPPNFPGYEPYCPFTSNPGPGGKGVWSAPGVGIEEARAIVRRSGTAGMRVTFEYPPEFWPQGADLGEYLVDLLGKIGYRGSVKRHSVEAFYDPENEFQMALAAYTADYPAASNLITEFFTCDAVLTPRSGFCDRQIDEMVEEATRLQIDDPFAAGALWAEIDRAIVDQAPTSGSRTRTPIGFVSERVGNYQFSLQWGILLNQLWVQVVRHPRRVISLVPA